MNYSKIEYFSTPNGPGCRTAVYFSGCERAMDGKPCACCHNPIAWNKEAGKPWTEEIEKEVLEKSKPPYIKGFSILGGEPLSDFNIYEITSFVKKAKELYPEKDIWLWTGYTIEYVQENKPMEIFNYIDYVVDGEFIQGLKIFNLRFRGSTNQRILRVEKGENNEFKFFDETGKFSLNN